ncbi:unnamed protein product [Auanema sp. JU1783]|nr:unnamed protein product [Auanema sp. JU1783]
MNNQVPTYGSENQPKAALHLNNEEIQHLLNKISSDEQKELTETMRSCTSEVAMTRGLPISAAILGSLYFARTRLPAQYHFGPKGWGFYAIMGIGSMTVVNLFSMGLCRERIQPKISQLWTKYQQGGSSQTYEAIRAQHRNGQPYQQARPEVQQDYYDPQHGYATSRQQSHSYGAQETHSSQGYDYNSSSSDGNSFDLTQDEPQKTVPRPAPQFLYDDSPTFMSGTPSGNKRNDF